MDLAAVVLQRWVLVAILLLVAGTGCQGRGHYRASWTLEGETLICSGVPPAELASSRCGTAGIDAVKIETIDGMGFVRDVSIFACGRCTSAEGPSLAAGTYILRATPLGSDLRDLGEPGTSNLAVEQTNVVIKAGGSVEVAFDLIIPPQCSNAIDDDIDGLVDLMDPSCVTPNDSESDGGVADGGPDAGAPDGGVADGGPDAPVSDGGPDGAPPDASLDAATDMGGDVSSADAGAADAAFDASLDAILSLDMLPGLDLPPGVDL